jgi:hypothetical protein
METPNISPNPPPMAMLSKTMENAIPKLMPIKSAESNLLLYFNTQHPFQLFNICTPIRDFSFEGDSPREGTDMKHIVHPLCTTGSTQADKKTPAVSFWAAARKLLGAQVEKA